MTQATPRERPILMTGEMVRVTMAGLKYQTRKVIKAETIEVRLEDFDSIIDAIHSFEDRFGPAAQKYLRCPYGVPGDLLYVREGWRPWSWHEGEPLVFEYKADGARAEIAPDLGPDEWYDYEQWEDRIRESLTDEMVAAGIEPDENGIYEWEGESPLRWRPSIHMPKWASRLWLRITDVRVERVQDISEEDAIAEGCDATKEVDHSTDGKSLGEGFVMGPMTCYHSAVGNFEILWDSINAKRGYGWDENPYVWALTYERVEAP